MPRLLMNCELEAVSCPRKGMKLERSRGLSVPHVSNLEQVQELYGAFGRGEIEPVLAALAPDVEWVDGKVTRFESFQDTLATARVLGAVD